MQASQIADVCEPADVTVLDRADLIALVQKLERQRSVWELRIRACEEREQLYLTFMNDMGQFLAETFQVGHDAISQRAAVAESLIEAIRVTVQRVEDI